MTPVCGVAELLRPGGPVRVPLRECCAAALVGAGGETSACAAARVGPGRAAFPAAGSARLASPAVAAPAVRRATGPDGDRGQPAEVAR
ncbi:hypothetical protein [Actinoplanes campanulatus]|uniref:hypothetical protein n=1 Tax=Actinoplanes campanulatus TaxID=113559 RepID=UPI001953CF9C|nr:hypothetical protein [Actinoplanes capillaceus]